MISALMPIFKLHIAKTTSPHAKNAGEVILLPKVGDGILFWLNVAQRNAVLRKSALANGFLQKLSLGVSECNGV